MLSFLFKLLPEKYHTDVQKLYDAGFSPMEILAFVIKYRDEITAVVQTLIELFKSVPVASYAVGTAHCDKELLAALCNAECAAMEALWAVHQAKHLVCEHAKP